MYENIVYNEFEVYLMFRISSHLRILELKKGSHLRKKRDQYYDQNLTEAKRIEFWAISRSHAYSDLWHWLLRWLFELSQGNFRKCFAMNLSILDANHSCFVGTYYTVYLKFSDWKSSYNCIHISWSSYRSHKEIIHRNWK